MRYIFILLLLAISLQASAARVYSPNTSYSMSPTASYCQSASATPISFRYTACRLGTTGTISGVTLTVEWYANTTNSTTGGILVASSSTVTATSTTAGAGTLTYTPSTASLGTTYYYCKISWDGTGQCNTSGSLTSATTTRINVVQPPSTITGSSGVCVGSQITLANSISGGTWTSSSTATATVGSATGVVGGVAAGTTTISYATGCGTAATKTITVSALPAAITPTGTVSVCTGSVTTLASTTTGGTWSSSSTSLATVGSGTGIVTGVAAGSPTITYTSSAGCIRTKAVTVAATPGAISGSSSVCTGSTATYTNATTGGTWARTNAGGSASSINSSTGVLTAGASTGTPTISYTVGSCRATRTITVNASPATITPTTAVSVCAGSTTTLANTSAGGTWTSSNTAVATVNTSGVVTGVSAGSVNITYTIGSCFVVKSITVAVQPGAINGATSICTGSLVTLTNSVSGGTWSSSATGVATVVAASGIVGGVAAGNFNITYTVGSCRTVKADTVVQTPAITPTTAVSVCRGGTTTLASTTTGGIWSSSSIPAVATVSSAGVVFGVSQGYDTISYYKAYTTTGCVARKPVEVRSIPNTIAGASSVCRYATTTLTDTASVGGTWSSTNTGIATVGSATGIVGGVAAGTVTISYTTGCGAAVTRTMTVNAGPNDITGASGVCLASTITLANTIASGTWTSSSSLTASVGSSTGVVTGVSPGTATISYTLGVCTKTKPVLVGSSPAAIGGTASTCRGTSTTLTNSVASGVWSSSNTSIATVDASSGVVSGLVAGTATISYSTGCGTPATRIFTVIAQPAEIGGASEVCMGSTISLTNSVAGGTWSSASTARATINASGVVTGVTAGDVIITYSISGCIDIDTVTVNLTPSALTGSIPACTGSIGVLSSTTPDGLWSSTDTVNAIVTEAGEVTTLDSGAVTIIYTLGSCSTSASRTIIIQPNAIAGVATVCEGSTLSLTNTVGGGVWSSSSTPNATVGSSTGVVSGIANGAAYIYYTTGGICKDSALININATPATSVGPSFVCTGLTTDYSNALTGGEWSSSNPAVATVDADGTVTGIAAGTFTLTYNVGGCWSARTLNTYTQPDVIVGASTVCQSGTTTLTNTVAGGTWSSSSTAIATVGAATGVVGGVAEGTSTISYSNNGCYVTSPIDVSPLPVVPAITGTANVCVADTTLLENTNPDGVWSTSNAAIATVLSTGEVVGVSAGSCIITYAVTNSCGTVRDTDVVTVLVLPTPTFTSAPSAIVCTGVNATYTTQVSQSNYDWTVPGTVGVDYTIVSGGIGSTNNTVTLKWLTGGNKVVAVNYTNANGCSGLTDGVTTTTVVAIPVLTVTPTNPAIAAGGFTTMTASGATTYTWAPTTFLNVTTGATVITTASVATTYTITGTTSGCSGTTTNTVTVAARPTITALSSYSSNAGTTLTITGANFNATSSLNGVYFGSIPASVVSGSSTSLSVTVPTNAEFGPVTVMDNSKQLLGQSPRLYLPKFDNAAYISTVVNFAPKVDFSTGTSPIGVTMGDVDGDGKSDMIVANSGANTISVYRNVSTSGTVSTSSFEAAQTYSTAAVPNFISVADMDNDGKQDIVVADSNAAKVSILRNTTTGTGTLSSSSFATTVDLTVGSRPKDIALADFDGDGRIDIACANSGANTITIYKNLCSPGTISTTNFGTAVSVSTNTLPSRVVASDLDGDGKMDLATVAPTSARINVYRNTSTAAGNIAFSTSTTLTTTSASLGIAIADIDGDGKQDILCTNSATSNFSIFKNASTSGTLSFAAKIDSSTLSTPRDISIGDFNGDGKPDVAIGTASGFTVYRNTSVSGTVSFAARKNFTGNTISQGNTAADVDGDNEFDFVVTNRAANTVSIFKNDPLGPIVGAGAMCTGNTATLTNTATSGAWTVSAPAVATITSGGVVTALTPGTAIVTYTVSGGSDTALITVTATPTVVATPVSSAICNGSSTSITASGASTYSWSPSTGLSATTGASVLANPITTTTYTVTGTSAAGCSSTASQLIAVNPVPVLTVTPVSSTICSGGSTSITASGASTYSWSPSTGLSATTGASVLASPTTTVTYTVTGTSVAGCSSTASQLITVNAVPVVTVTPVSSTICSGSSTSITASGASTYSWSPSTGLSVTTGASVLASPTTTVTYTVTGTGGLGCSSTSTRTITVNPTPVLTVTPVFSSICNGSSTSITASGASTYSWSPSTGLSATTGASVLANPTTTRTYTVTGTSADGCSSTSTRTITVVPSFVLTVTPMSSVICSGNSISITASGATVYSWSPSTGLSATTGSSVSASPTSTTTYTVTGMRFGYCNSTVSSTITVNPTPVLTITPTSATAICYGSSISISASGASTYSWSPSTSLSAPTGASVLASPTTSTVYTVTGTSDAGCSSAWSRGIIVVPLPVLTITPVSSTICSGGSTSITASGASTYSWSPSTGLSVTTGASVLASPTTTVTYTVTGTGSLSCSSTSTRTITVNPTPVLTVTPVFSTICNGSSTSITSSGASSYSWSPSTGLSATTGASVLANPTTTTTYTVTGTSGAGCSSTSTRTINVTDVPSIPAIVGTNITAPGRTVTLTNDTAGGVWSSSNTSIATISSTGIVSTLSAGLTTMSYAVTNSCGTSVVVMPFIVNQMQWVGGASGAESDWNSPTNWLPLTLPNASDDVTIPFGTTYTPTIPSSATVTVRNLTIVSGAAAVMSSSSILNVKGNVNNNGAITGSGKLVMNGITSQSISGLGSISSMEINNASGVSIASSSRVSINKELTITSGNFSTNDSLVLAADATSTARVAPITGGAILGTARVELYIPGGRRAFRFWSHPFTSALPLSQLTDRIDITGTGGATNGFTTTGSNAASAFRYNTMISNSALSYDPGWRPFTSTYGIEDTNRVHQYEAIRLFVRGAKGEGMGYESYTPSAVVLGSKGQLNQGRQVVNLQKGTGANQDYNLLGNPYASPVDIGTVIYNAKASGNVVGSAFYVWNPYMATSGIFQAIPIGTLSASPYFIQANAAFEVRAAHNGDSLVFNETNKGNAPTTTLLKATNDAVSLSIYDENNRPWDMLSLQFVDGASEAEDNDMDARKLMNPDLSFYSKSSDNKPLAIDVRSFNEDKVIPLGLITNKAQSFIVKAESVSLPVNTVLYLHDKLKDVYTELNAGAEYKFAVTSDATTKGDDRFELTTSRKSSAVPSIVKVSMQPNPASDDVTIQYSATVVADANVNVTDMNGVSVFNKQYENVKTGTIRLDVSNYASGIYIVTFTHNGKSTTHTLVKE